MLQKSARDGTRKRIKTATRLKIIIITLTGIVGGGAKGCWILIMKKTPCAGGTTTEPAGLLDKWTRKKKPYLIAIGEDSKRFWRTGKQFLDPFLRLFKS